MLVSSANHELLGSRTSYSPLFPGPDRAQHVVVVVVGVCAACGNSVCVCVCVCRCVCVCVLVAQSFKLFATPWDCTPPVSSVLVSPARLLEWVTIPFFRSSSQPRDQTWVYCMRVDSLPSEPPGKPSACG